MSLSYIHGEIYRLVYKVCYLHHGHIWEVISVRAIGKIVCTIIFQKLEFRGGCWYSHTWVGLVLMWLVKPVWQVKYWRWALDKWSPNWRSSNWNPKSKLLIGEVLTGGLAKLTIMVYMFNGIVAQCTQLSEMEQYQLEDMWNKWPVFWCLGRSFLLKRTIDQETYGRHVV